MAWDITTITYVGYDDVYGFYTANAVWFSPDGQYVAVLDSPNGQLVYETLSTPWDITSVSGSPGYINITGWDSLSGMYVRPDGLKLYITGSLSGVDTVAEFDIADPYDFSFVDNANYATLSVNDEDTAVYGIYFKPDGLKMYITGDTNNKVFEYDLGTAWDISTASYNSVSYTLNTVSSLARGLAFNNDGSRMFVGHFVTRTLAQYELSTPWDISSASYNSVYEVLPTFDIPRLSGFFISSDGMNFYAVYDVVHQLAMSGGPAYIDTVTASPAITDFSAINGLALESVTSINGNILSDEY